MGCPRLLGYCYSLAPMHKYFTRSQPSPPVSPFFFNALLRQSHEAAIPQGTKKCSLGTTQRRKLGEGRDDNCSVLMVWAEYEIHLLVTFCSRETSFCSFLLFFSDAIPTALTIRNSKEYCGTRVSNHVRLTVMYLITEKLLEGGLRNTAIITDNIQPRLDVWS